MGEILDVNVENAVTGSVNINASTKLSIFCKKHSGRTKNQVLVVEVSPNDSDWFSTNHYIGAGVQPLDVLGKWARVKVEIPDGEASVVELFFVTG